MVIMKWHIPQKNVLSRVWYAPSAQKSTSCWFFRGTMLITGNALLVDSPIRCALMPQKEKLKLESIDPRKAKNSRLTLLPSLMIKNTLFALALHGDSQAYREP